MSFPSESDMVSKEFQISDLIYVNLMTDVFKIIVKYRRKIIAKHHHLSPSGNRALGGPMKVVQRYREFLILLTFEIAKLRLGNNFDNLQLIDLS